MKDAIQKDQYRSIFQFVPAAILDRLFIAKVDSNISGFHQDRPPSESKDDGVSEAHLEVKGQEHIGQDRSLPVIGSDPLDQRAEAKDDAPSLRAHGQSIPLPTLPERKDDGMDQLPELPTRRDQDVRADAKQNGDVDEISDSGDVHRRDVEVDGIDKKSISKDMLKELLNYQPDLAIKLLSKAHNLLLDSDMVSSVASVTGWVMDPKNIITLFETKMTGLF